MSDNMNILIKIFEDSQTKYCFDPDGDNVWLNSHTPGKGRKLPITTEEEVEKIYHFLHLFCPYCEARRKA